MTRAGTLAGWIAVTLLVSSGCRGQQPSGATAVTVPAPVPCARVDAAIATGVHADTLAGSYRLTLTAQSGSRSGHSTSGSLVLTRYGSHVPPVASAASGATHYPLYGSTSITPDSVGAAAPGAVGATDLDAPGVLVMEWPSGGAAPGTSMMLRFGANANRGGPTPIEGEHLALTVTALSPMRFSGTWSSGLPGKTASGYFCADRVAARGQH